MVELPNHHRLASPQLVEQAVQLRAVPAATGCTLLEQFAASCSPERLNLKYVVPLVVSRNPAITERHSMAGRDSGWRLQ
jgi:hypothetical protein